MPAERHVNSIKKWEEVSISRIIMQKLGYSNFTGFLSSAQQSSTYSDFVCGPQKDWSFPSSSIGIIGSSLSSSEKALLLTAIKTYVDDIADAASLINDTMFLLLQLLECLITT